MTGSEIKASFSQRTEFKLELPRGTILEVELVPEMTGEVCQKWTDKLVQWTKELTNGQINQYNGQIELTNGIYK